MQEIISKIITKYKDIYNPYMPVYGELIEYLNSNIHIIQEQVCERDFCILLRNIYGIICISEELKPTDFVGHMNKVILPIFDIYFENQVLQNKMKMFKEQLTQELLVFKKTEHYEPKHFIY